MIEFCAMAPYAVVPGSRVQILDPDGQLTLTRREAHGPFVVLEATVLTVAPRFGEALIRPDGDTGVYQFPLNRLEVLP